MFHSPIFIPTKSRWLDLKTLSLLDNVEGIDTPTLVVEPHELEEYQKAVVALGKPDTRFMILGKSNQGLAYARNEILDFAQRNKLEWFWMIDDDVREAIVYFGGQKKSVRLNTALAFGEDVLKNVPGLAQGALEYDQFAWSAERALSVFGYCDCVVLMNSKRLGNLRYRSEVNLKEDRDFTIQVLQRGWRTARASQIGFRVPKIGSNKGGLYDQYQLKKDEDAARLLHEKYPRFTELVKKDSGRWDVKIDWKCAYVERGAAK